MRRILSVVVILSLAAPLLAGEAKAPLAWESWSDDLFVRAHAGQRFVLLDLEAVWCHWCHVMAETTYRDPQVVRLIQERFLPVRVDEDARPDLANRYEDYGWPATVVFDSSGQEIVKFSGYIPPGRMAALLQGILDDPTPGPSVREEAVLEPAAGALLSDALRADLEAIHRNRYDEKNGGWGTIQKFLDPDSVEYCLARAGEGDAAAERMARRTLAAQLKLVDPVWGGVYQYSDSGDWDHPHFEKIMWYQAKDLRIYALAYARWHEPADLKAARDIHRYLESFLKGPLGAFYTSQDADLVPGEHSAEYYALSDAGRRRRGIPRIDTHLYARENAWVADALVALYGATGETAILDEATRTAEWIVANRALPAGGYRHDERDPAGPYLGDATAAGRAFLSLYSAGAGRVWLTRAEEALAFIGARFRRQGVPGFLTTASAGTLEARPQRDENLAVARLANLLYHYTGKVEPRRIAEDALRLVATPSVARRFETAGPLLADREARAAPVHLAVVGRRDDPQAQALLATALGHPSPYKRVELWDRDEGTLPRANVDFPKLDRPAAFLCNENRCSPPLFTVEELRARLAPR